MQVNTSPSTNTSPLKRAAEKSRFEVLSWRVFERCDGSAPRVTPAPQIVGFQTGFRAELGLPFLWILSFGNAKESISPTAKSLLSGLAVKTKINITNT
jgi:hypothetical protein